MYNQSNYPCVDRIDRVDVPPSIGSLLYEFQFAYQKRTNKRKESFLLVLNSCLADVSFGKKYCIKY